MLGFRHTARAIKEVLFYNSCRITGFGTVITAPFVVFHIGKFLNPAKASCL